MYRERACYFAVPPGPTIVIAHEFFHAVQHSHEAYFYEDTGLWYWVVHKLRAYLQAPHTEGLVRANERFAEWLLGEHSLPIGEDHEHVTIKLVDYERPERNRYAVSQQVTYRMLRLSTHISVKTSESIAGSRPGSHDAEATSSSDALDASIDGWTSATSKTA